MTYQDVMATIFSEVSGKPVKIVHEQLNKIPTDKRGNLDKECPDAETTLAKLRLEKPGILNWMIEGLRKNILRCSWNADDASTR